MTVTIIKKQVVGEAEERRPAIPPKPATGKLTKQQVIDRFRAMAVGSLMLEHPNMSLAEAKARLEGTEPCNQLHALAINLTKELNQSS